MDDLENLGLRIKSIREQLGLNQADFAEKLGLSGPSAVSKYEKAQNEPNIAMLRNISKLGNKSLDWLLTGEEPVSPREAAHLPDVQRYIDMLAEVLERGSQDEKDIIRGKIAEEYRKFKEAVEPKAASKKGA